MKDLHMSTQDVKKPAVAALSCLPLLYPRAWHTPELRLEYRTDTHLVRPAASVESRPRVRVQILWLCHFCRADSAVYHVSYMFYSPHGHPGLLAPSPGVTENAQCLFQAGGVLFCCFSLTLLHRETDFTQRSTAAVKSPWLHLLI